MANGLFGAAQDVARSQALDQRLRRAQILGGLGPGGHGALAGMQIGGGLGGMLFGAQDPALAQMGRLQQIGQEMQAQGLEPGTPGFAAQVYARMLAAGFPPQQALQAFTQAQQAEQGAAKIAELRSAIPQPGAIQARARALRRRFPQLSEEGALELARDVKQFGQAMRQSLGVDKPPTSFQEFELAQADPAFRSFLEQKAKASGTRIELMLDKPMSATDAQKIDMPGGGSAFGMSPRAALAAGGRLKSSAELAGETAKATNDARLESAKSELPRAFAEYRRAAAVPEAQNPLSSAYRLAENARQHLATQVAIVESRGAEPNANKIQNVLERTPDFHGPIDSRRLPAAISQMERLQLGNNTPGEPVDSTLEDIKKKFPGAVVEELFQ